MIPFIPAIIILGIIGYITDQHKKDINLDKLIDDQQMLLKLKGQALSDHLTPVLADLHFLANVPVVKEFSPDSVSEKIVDELQLFSVASRFSQIRIIDTSGRETVRVDFKQKESFVVPQKDLQNKNHREYFQKGIRLKENQVYISPIDLNREFGKIEIPFHPVIRLMTPIFSVNQEKTGLLVINYSAMDLFQRNLKWKPTEDSSAEFYITNKKGYPLNNTGSFQPFGFHFDSLKDETIKSKFPKQWEKIVPQKEGKVLSEDQLFVFRRFDYSSLISRLQSGYNIDFTLPENNHVYLMFYTDKPTLHQALTEHRTLYMQAWIVLILFFLAIWLSYTKEKVKDKEKLLSLSYQNIKQKEQLLSIKNAQLESFIRIASHDLREPLATIKSIAGTMTVYNEKPIDQKFSKYLGFIIECADRLDSLTRGILDYALTGRNSELVTINVKEILEVVEMDLRGAIERSDATIIYDGLPTLNAFRLEMRQLFQNLVSNAIKYSRNDVSPVIRVEHSYENKTHSFRIIDNGIGISEEDRDKIFKMFHRTHKKTDAEGLGIGLAITKKIIELHQGTIWVEENPEGGTIFCFTIQELEPIKSSL